MSELRQRKKENENKEEIKTENTEREQKKTTIFNRIKYGFAMAIPFILLCIYGGLFGIILLIFTIEVFNIFLINRYVCFMN